MKNSKQLFFALRLLVTIGISIWVWKRLQGTGETPIELFESVDVWVFAVPSLVISVNTLVHAIRLWILFKAAAQPISLTLLLSAILKGHFVGLILPMGGADIVKISYLSQAAGGSSLAAAMLGLARLLEMIPWGSALLLGGFVLLKIDWTIGIMAIGCGLSLLLTCVGGMWVSQRKISSWSRGPEKLRRFVERLEEGLHHVGKQPKPLLLVSSLGLCFLFMNTLCLWLLCGAFDEPLLFLEVLTLFPLIDFLVSLPISLNGVGVRESVYPLLLASHGLGMDVALAVAWTRWTGEIFRAGVGGILFLGDHRAT